MSLTKQDLENAVKRAVEQALVTERSQAASQNFQQREQHRTMTSIDECPECHKSYGVDQFKTDTIRKAWSDRKDSSMQCSKCKFPVRVHDRDNNTSENEDPDCPLCHNKDAENRY